MRAGIVSTRYATALYELARDKRALAEVQADVDAIAAEMRSPQARALFDGRVPFEQKRARIQALSAKFHALTSNFVQLLLDKRRLEVLQDLPQVFRRLSLADRGATEGVVEAPRPLGQGELAEIAVAVKAVLGKDVQLTTRNAPELIAGVRVLVDNRLIDQSALGRLEGLRSKLLRTRLN